MIKRSVWKWCLLYNIYLNLSSTVYSQADIPNVIQHYNHLYGTWNIDADHKINETNVLNIYFYRKQTNPISCNHNWVIIFNNCLSVHIHVHYNKED